MRRDIDQTIQRSRRYWYDDGLGEIAIGVVLMAVGALLLTEAFRLIPPGISALALPVVVIGGWWLAGLAVRAAKNRITYPRTGYVRYPRPARRPRRLVIAVGVGAAFAALAVVLALLAPASLAWLPTSDGVLVGAFFVYMAYSAGLARFYLLGLVSVIAGLSTSLSGLGDSMGSGVYFAATGAAIALSGVVVLALYLRSTRPPEGDPE